MSKGDGCGGKFGHRVRDKTMNTNRLIHAGFWFGKSDVKEALELAKAGVGGFCIYFGTTKEVKELIAALRAAAPSGLIISADYEYGLGRWHKDAQLLPSNISIGAARKEDLSYKKGLITARQARELGVDWVLAPNVDLADTPANPIVNTRSFGKDASLVTDMAKAFMLGLADGGCLNCLKHFPGHGSTLLDSHLSLPTVNKSLAKLQEEDLIPYKKLLTKADAIMPSHLLVPAFDKEKPASFSEKTIQGFLRRELHYKGLIVTDALIMKATGGLEPVDAFKAGADILLCPENPFEVMAKLEKEVKKDRSLIDHAISALSEQEMMIAKLKAAEDFVCKDCAEQADKLSFDTARAGICLKGEDIKLKHGKSVTYLEIDVFPGGEMQAKDFYNKLKAEGIKLKPYKAGDKSDVLIISTMANYAAFSGKINFSAEQKEIINKAAAKAGKSALVSFGSPFVDDGLKINSFLMAGTQTAPFQKVCADILLGKEAARGFMPV